MTAYLPLQAFYLEEHSPIDGKQYYYVSFQVGINNAREVHFLKFSAPSDLSDLSI